MNVALFSSTIDARRAARRIDADDAHDLMPALVVFEEEARAVRRPVEVVDAPRIRDQLLAHRDLRALLHVEEPRARLRDAVAGLEVIVALELGLELIRGR